MKEKEAVLLFGDDKDPNIVYATGFEALDPVIYIQTEKRKILVVNQLEIERAKIETKNNGLEIIDYNLYFQEKGVANYLALKAEEIISGIFKDLDILRAIVPRDFPLGIADGLRRQGLLLETKEEPFFPQRAIKTQQEIEYIHQNQQIIEQVLGKAINLIKKSKIKGDLIYTPNGRVLTSELLHEFVNLELIKRGNCYSEKGMIISSGEQTAIPHHQGQGPIEPNTSIIFDIFPCSRRTKYWGDMTRTVVKGEADSDLKEVYQTVLEAQEIGISMLKPVINGQEVYTQVYDFFNKQGYEEKIVHGQKQGFIHRLGHGIGLEIHEWPYLQKEDIILGIGNVISVEPGLYFPGEWGVRIEDLLALLQNGCVNLNKFHKKHLMEL